MRGQNLRRLLPALGLPTFLAGCLPIPVPPFHESGTRQNIGAEMRDRVILGETTREQLLMLLGEADGFGANDRWLAWGSASGQGGLVLFPVFGAGPIPGIEYTTYRRLVVYFDESGVASDVTYDVKTCHQLYDVEGGHRGNTTAPCLDITAPDGGK